MAIDTTPSQVATSALQAIPFGSIIGGPLKACIEAQAMAAQTSWQFINGYWCIFCRSPFWQT